MTVINKCILLEDKPFYVLTSEIGDNLKPLYIMITNKNISNRFSYIIADPSHIHHTRQTYNIPF